jgi:hypothetical protein
MGNRYSAAAAAAPPERCGTLTLLGAITTGGDERAFSASESRFSHRAPFSSITSANSSSAGPPAIRNGSDFSPTNLSYW